MNTAELKQACVAKLEQMPEHKLQETLNFLSQQLEQDLEPIQIAANDEQVCISQLWQQAGIVRKTRKKIKPEDLVGRLQYQGKPKSLEEIETALQEAMKKEWLENER